MHFYQYIKHIWLHTSKVFFLIKSFFKYCSAYIIKGQLHLFFFLHGNYDLKIPNYKTMYICVNQNISYVHIMYKYRK